MRPLMLVAVRRATSSDTSVMNDYESRSPAGPDNPGENRGLRSVRRTYEGYRRSRRKQRAWEGANPGNVAIRAELRERALQLAAPALNRTGPILDLGCGTGWWLSEIARSGVDPARLHG